MLANKERMAGVQLAAPWRNQLQLVHGRMANCRQLIATTHGVHTVGLKRIGKRNALVYFLYCCHGDNAAISAMAKSTPIVHCAARLVAWTSTIWRLLETAISGWFVLSR